MTSSEWLTWVDLAVGFFGLKDSPATSAWFDAVRETWTRDGQVIHSLADLRAATIAVARGEKCWPDDMLRRLEAELASLELSRNAPQSVPAAPRGDPNEDPWRCPAAIPTCSWGTLGILPHLDDIVRTPQGPAWDTSFDDVTVFCRCKLGHDKYMSTRGYMISKGRNPDRVFDIDRYEFELARRFFEGDITAASEWWPRQEAEKNRRILARAQAEQAARKVKDSAPKSDPSGMEARIDKALAKAGAQ